MLHLPLLSSRYTVGMEQAFIVVFAIILISSLSFYSGLLFWTLPRRRVFKKLSSEFGLVYRESSQQLGMVHPYQEYELRCLDGILNSTHVILSDVCTVKFPFVLPYSVLRWIGGDSGPFIPNKTFIETNGSRIQLGGIPFTEKTPLAPSLNLDASLATSYEQLKAKLQKIQNVDFVQPIDTRQDLPQPKK